MSQQTKFQSPVDWLSIQLYEKMNMAGNEKVFDELIDQAKIMEEDVLYTEYMNGYEKGWETSNENFRSDVTRLYNKYNFNTPSK